jgi:hypothetical protein
MSWKENINSIKEKFPGHFQIILDGATSRVLEHFLSDAYKYVWVYTYETENSLEWETYDLPIFESSQMTQVMARRIRFSFVTSTERFKELLPKLKSGISVAQVNVLPKYYLDPLKIEGKTRYDLLRDECDYLFEMDVPSATDYGTLISSKYEYLQSLLNNERIDWSNLP